MSAGEVADWDAEAEGYDEPADHGLRDPSVRAAWRLLLLGVLPQPPARVAEMGCGTGTLSVLMAEAGLEVDALDFSPAMLATARAKGAGRSGLRFIEADASHPPFEEGAYDAVLARHVLWALPDPADALARWLRLLGPGGTLVLVEGHWSTGAGLSAEQAVMLVEGTGREARLTRLDDPALWGRTIDDDRYLVVSPSPDRS